MSSQSLSSARSRDARHEVFQTGLMSARRDGAVIERCPERDGEVAETGNHD